MRKYINNHTMIETTSNIDFGRKWFMPSLGIKFDINWTENYGEFGIYIYLILFNVYVDWFQEEQFDVNIKGDY